MSDPSGTTPPTPHSRGDRSGASGNDDLGGSTLGSLPMRRIQSLHELANHQPSKPSSSGLNASPMTASNTHSFSGNLAAGSPSQYYPSGTLNYRDDQVRHHSLNEDDSGEGRMSRNNSSQDVRWGHGYSTTSLDGFSPRLEPDVENHSAEVEAAAQKAESRSWTPMVSELPPLWRIIAQRVFSKVLIEPDRLRKLYTAQQEGTPVHVAQTQSWLSYLVLNLLFVRHKLRRTHLAPGLTFIPWLPAKLQWRSFWGRFLRLLGMRGQMASDLVRDLVAGDRPVLLFLRLPQTWFTRAREFIMWTLQSFFMLLFAGRLPDPDVYRYDAAEHLVQLIRLQRSPAQTRPIYLCPQNIIWDRTPTSESDSYFRRVLDFVFGEKESPGLLREFYLLLRDWHRVRLRGGNPIDLREFLKQQQESTPEGMVVDDLELARRLQDLLQDRFERETRTVRGPKNKPYAHLRQAILRSQHLQRVVHQMAQEEHQAEISKLNSELSRKHEPTIPPEAQSSHLQRKVDQTWRRCLSIVDEMAAAPSIFLVRIFSLILRRVFSQIYRGIDYNEDGIEKIRQAALKGPVVLVPSHKSHLDYLLISYIFFKEDFSIPMIAAGNNLNIPIVGFIFRRCGAYFIRRSFVNDKLYTAVFKEYVTHLLQEGFPVEFFIEGGRSRSGKVLPPKLGLLGMVVDAVFDGRLDDVSVVPISIGYDKIIETKSYSSELLGAEKKKESVMDLLSARKYLKYNFGRVGVKFADPISIREYLESQQSGKESLAAIDPISNLEHRRHFVRSLGYRITYDINRVSVAMPTSLVVAILLTMRTRGISRAELIERVDWLKSLIQSRGGQVAAFEDTPTIVDRTLDCLGNDLIKIPTKLQLLDTVVRPRNKYRLELAYYRNQILHIFNNEGMIACALFSLAKNGKYRSPNQPTVSTLSAVPVGDLLEAVKFFSHLMKYELTFKPNAVSLEDTFYQTLNLMISEESIMCVESDSLSPIAESEHEIEESGRQPLLFTSSRLSEKALVSSGNPMHFDFLCALFWPFIDSYWAASLGLLGLLPDRSMEETQFAKRLLTIAETLYQEGQIEYGDSVSSETLKNAVTLFIDMGVVTKTELKAETPSTDENSGASALSSSSPSASVSAAGKQKSKSKSQTPDKKTMLIRLQSSYQTEQQLQEFIERVGKFRNLPKQILV